MNRTELLTYIHVEQPYWEILDGNSRAAAGMYRFMLLQNDVKIQKHTNNGWEFDGTASWEFVEKIVIAHKAGKRGCDLGQDLFRKRCGAVWR